MTRQLVKTLKLHLTRCLLCVSGESYLRAREHESSHEEIGNHGAENDECDYLHCYTGHHEMIAGIELVQVVFCCSSEATADSLAGQERIFRL